MLNLYLNQAPQVQQLSSNHKNLLKFFEPHYQKGLLFKLYNLALLIFEPNSHIKYKNRFSGKANIKMGCSRIPRSQFLPKRIKIIDRTNTKEIDKE